MLYSCGQPSIQSNPPLCKEHFVKRFEERVQKTIRDFHLLSKKDSVLVAASGGKDSLTTLFILKKLGYDVSALAIDEGIAGYREHTLHDLTGFCKKNKIPLRIVSFKDSFGKTLDRIIKEQKPHPCTVCGTLRRYLLNKHANGYDVIATGHNADDEAQSVLMNLARANIDLFPRGGPVTTSRGEGFIKRVKPLYFCTEKEVLTYAVLNGFAGTFTECSYATQAYRAEIRDELNEYERNHPGAKIRILKQCLNVKARVPQQSSVTKPCSSCGEPSQQGLCKACRLVTDINAAI
jgi:tRNA-5-methyluridine54 2-sulfurtransferase